MKISKAILIVLGGICLVATGCTDEKKADQKNTEKIEQTVVTLEKSSQNGKDIRIPHNERLNLSTDQKWIEEQGHQSDLIRLQWTAERAKPAIAWADEKGKDKTAIISHEKANNPEQQDHKHISIETTMSPTGQHADQLFTRFEIPYDTDVSEIRTHSSNFNVMSGVLRVAGESETNRDLQFSKSGNDNATTPRWTVRADNSKESGDNTGTNLQFVRYGDDGEVIDAPLTIQRTNGNIGVGANDPDTKLDINGDKLRIREKYTPASSKASCSQGQMAWDDQYVYVCVAEDSWKRTELSTW
ncbi:hypothetical protein [Paenibacillus dakarensis]|uniref:hypothetical protein n=1 Tax=Paenibacillus dakarensis TaxID=1527293 RepID=UPI0006D5785B|nr:hypothetical protein [Paenibacillus dakarensis]